MNLVKYPIRTWQPVGFDQQYTNQYPQINRVQAAPELQELDLEDDMLDAYTSHLH